MGRGRGRGRGRPNRRGRGGGRGGQHQRISSKDASHLREFGEMHPSEELSSLNPPAAKKARGGKFSNSAHLKAEQQRKERDESSESDSEEETTPYGELLSMLSGKKSNKIEIVSESEEDDDEEEEEEDEDDDEEVEEDHESVNGKEVLMLETNELEGENGVGKSKKKVMENDSDESYKTAHEGESEDEHEEEVKEETVILEEELDPEAKDEDVLATSEDPFLLHFERELPLSIQNSLKASAKIYTSIQSLDLPLLEKVQYCGVSVPDDTDDKIVNNNECQLDAVQKKYAAIPSVNVLKKRVLHSEPLSLKQQLLNRVAITNQACLDKIGCTGPVTPLQHELLALMGQYVDIYFPERTFENQNFIQMAYCIHVVNHVLKTRTRILHHNAKMATKVEVPEEFRDQSFVRPKVLILVPFKESALRIVKILISLILDDVKGMVANKKRFMDEYSGDTLFMPKTNPKPDDYMATFAGNIDDNFKLGISVTKKSVKLFSDFYSSDIIIASPLGLRMIIGAEGEADRDYDFLSSIEVTVMDQADIFLMQNWDHMIHAFKHLHLQPITTHGTDFGRIRPWALDGLTKFYSQTLMFSSVNCPELVALFSRHCKNYAGLIKLRNPIVKGTISRVTVQLPQVFQRFDAASVQDVNDARFDFFINKILPSYSNRLMSQTLIFVSSYFDFVRLRNYFKREGTSFVQICEYTKDKKVARARDLFFHGENHFLLYTERAMFFRRFRLKGIGHIIFYQLPQNPQFYSELCNFIQEGYQSKRVRQRKNSSVTALYCNYDASRLASIVGTERTSFMLSSDKKVHAFVTGEV